MNKGYDSKEHEEKENINKDKTPAVAKNPDVFDVHTASWKTDDKTYTVTRSTIKIENKLREQNCVLVVGCSGNGKSATIRHIALKLCKNEGYDIIPNVVNPTTISQNYNQNKKQLFVIDNFCGEVVTNAQIVALWSSQIDDILKLTKNNQEQKDRQPGKGNLKLLFATIPGIFKDTITICKRIGCLSEYKLDLSEIPLQDEEKLEMIKKYFPEQMSNDLTKTLIRHEDIFPLLCKLSKGKTADQIEQLFLNHKLVIKNDFMAQKNKNQKCLMVLCVLFESLHEDDFSVEKNTPEKDKSVIETVCSEFDVNLKKKTSRLKLQNELKHLDEKYFIKLGDSYQLVHKDVYDIAAIYCGDTIRNSFISFAPSSVIAERCSFISKNSSEREPYIFIDDDTNKNYFDRLMTDLGKGITYSMFHNSQLLKESYIEAFCSYCRKRREKLVELLNRLQQRSFKPFNHLSDKEKASSEGNFNVYDDYLEFTKSYHFASHNMKIPLIESAWEGITDIVDLLLDMERKVNVTDRFGRSALYVACYHGKASVAKLLLERGAEHSLCDNDETSPLHAACIGGQKDVVQLLIEKKADINKCNKKGVSPLMAACSAGRISVVSVLVNSKVNINKIDNNGKSALFKACKKGHHEIVEILLQNGANVMQCDWANLSPLYIASAKGRTKTVSVLLDYKVDISYSDEQGRSPLFMACENGYEDIVDILLEKSQRVDLRTADKRNRSPLYVACGKGFIKIVKKLVTKGAKINQCDNSHSTPLLKASIEGHFDIVEYLISHTADLNAFDSNGRTPLLAACDEGHIEIVRVLVEKGSNINHRDNDNRNALEITQNRGYSDIEDILKNWLTE